MLSQAVSLGKLLQTLKWNKDIIMVKTLVQVKHKIVYSRTNIQEHLAAMLVDTFAAMNNQMSLCEDSI
jgi:hypothetical protein